jgi:hypothetical protein
MMPMMIEHIVLILSPFVRNTRCFRSYGGYDENAHWVLDQPSQPVRFIKTATVRR